MNTSTWTLDDALTLIRLMQPHVHALGYHIALGGSVLNKGIGYKDLDLYLLPMGQTVTPDPVAVRAYLSRYLGTEYTLGGPDVRPVDIDIAYPPEATWVNGRYTYRQPDGYHVPHLRTDVFIA